MPKLNAKISIITVCYNAYDDLKFTIDNIRTLKTADVEYIIVDGNSSDQSVELIKENEDIIDHWISEPDTGIYNAMNKGIALATGKWLNFMNAGDGFYRDDVLNKIPFNQFADQAIIYGSTYRREHDRITKALPIENIKLGSVIACHQSMFFNKDILGNDLIYSEHLELAGDSELLIKLYAKRYSFKSLDLCMADYKGDGLSARKIPFKILMKNRWYKYKRIVQHFGIWTAINSLLGLKPKH